MIEVNSNNWPNETQIEINALSDRDYEEDEKEDSKNEE